VISCSITFQFFFPVSYVTKATIIPESFFLAKSIITVEMSAQVRVASSGNAAKAMTADFPAPQPISKTFFAFQLIKNLAYGL
jgi:hypothetical protein